jgi:NADH dehydrogenase
MSVRILVRHGSNFQHLVDAGATPVFGDLKDKKSVEKACKNVKIVITSATSAKREGADNPTTVDNEGSKNLIDAAKEAGVNQFIFVSANIAHPNNPIPLMQAKGVTEEYLRASGVPYTIVAPDAFMDVWIALVVGMPAMAGRPVVWVGTGERKHSFISAVDVAKFIFSSINNPKAINRKLVIGGPKPLSFKDAAEAFKRAIGHDVVTQSVNLGEPLPGFPLQMAQFVGGFDTYDSIIEMTGLSEEFKVKLTTLEEFAVAFISNAKAR